MSGPIASQPETCESICADWLSDWLRSFAEAESKQFELQPGATSPAVAPSEERLRTVKEYLSLLQRAWPERNGSFELPVDDFLSRTLPARLGRFELIRVLGRGAHGNVYHAVDTLLGRDVALKVPRAESLASPELRRRFLREAQAVAALSHPHLVTIYEAGAWGPIHYIASTLCAGPNLAQWMARQDQPIAVRNAARLVATLAEAAAYVHSQGIVHRDLKPSNVLLEPLPGGSPHVPSPDSLDFSPKLTDFGLAKWLSAEADATATGDVLGTPAYMAPEQASGRVHEVGPAADIYALGAILYHLMTGRAPFQGPTKAETLRLVIEGVLIPPSRLRGDLPRDLEAICLKCTEHEAKRRYTTAGELAADLRRFLAGEPVLARRAGSISRLAKWSRRRPLVATLSYSLALVVLVALAALTWQWRGAEQHRVQAEQNFLVAHNAFHEFQTILFEGDKYDDPRFQELRKELLEASLKYYRRFVDQRPNDPTLLSNFAHALYETAFVTSTRGSKTDALSLFMESLPIWEMLTRVEPDTAEHRYFLAKTHHHIGILQQRFGDMDAARVSNQCALAICEALVESYPAVPSYRNQLGSCCYQCAEQYASKKEWVQCLRYAEQTRQIFGLLVREYPERTECQRMLAASDHLLGHAHLGAGRSAAALQCYERARDACEELLERKIEMPGSAKLLAQTLLAIGSVKSTTDRVQAMQSYQRCLLTLNQLLSLDPSVTAWRRDLAACHFHIGVLMRVGDEDTQRQEHLETALKIREQLVLDDPQVLVHRRDLGQTMLELGKISIRDGKLDDAIDKLESAYPLTAEWVAHYPNDLNCQMQLSIAQLLMGDVQSRKENPTEAIRAYRNAVLLQQQVLRLAPDRVTERARLAEIFTSLGSELSRLQRYSEAEPEYLQAIEQLDSIQEECGLTANQQRIRAIACEGLAVVERALIGGS